MIYPKLVIPFFAVVVSSSSVGFAQTSLSTSVQALPELLAPVDHKEIKDVLKSNDLFLKEMLYTSKRHRIVKVNTSLLYSEETLTFTPFEDAPHTLSKKELKQSDTLTRWRGEIIFPKLDSYLEYALSNPGVVNVIQPDVVKKKLRESLLSVTLLISQTRRRTTPGQQTSLEHGTEVPAITNDPTGLSSDAVIVQQFTTVQGFIGSRSYGTSYILQPLPNNPEFHIVSENDYEKMMHPGELKSSEKVKKYEKFQNEIKQERKRRESKKNRETAQ